MFGIAIGGILVSWSYLLRHPFKAMKQIAEAKKHSENDMRGEESPAERCRKNGWKVGTRLVGVGGTGSQGHGTTVIELMSIGERMILVKVISFNGKQVGNGEREWSFDDREWKEIAPETTDKSASPTFP